MPTDTNINKLWVNADWMFHNATCNFWRSAENFSVNDYCMWANSQAVSLRRVNFNDGIVLAMARAGHQVALWQTAKWKRWFPQVHSNSIFLEITIGDILKMACGIWFLQV